MATNLTNTLSLPKSWQEDLNKKLREPSINNKYEDWIIDKSFGTETDVFAISLKAGAKAGFRVFNDETDKDEPNDLIKNPYPGIGVDNAMIRYDLEASLKASAGVNFKNLGFDFDTSQKLTTSFYSVHSNEITLQDAVIKDLTDFKIIFSANDVTSLKTNECLALSYFGEIGATLKLSYIDALSGTISALTEFLPDGKSVKLTGEAGTSISFKVRIKDDFYVLISKTGNDLYSITINKISLREGGVIGKAGVEVTIEDSDSLIALQNVLLDALFDKPVEKLEDIIENHLGNLSNEQKEILSFIGERLGIVMDFDQPDFIKEQYTALKNKTIEKINKHLHDKLSLGFQIEYRRENKTSTVFQATATKAAISQNLKSIVMLQPSKLEDVDGINIEKYLLKKETTITRRVGLALAFGNLKISSEVLKSFDEQTIEDKLANTYDVQFTLLRQHSRKGSNDRKWFLSLSGKSETPSQSLILFDDVKTALAIEWHNKQRKTSNFELEQFLDLAVLWKCIETNEFDSIKTKIETAIGDLSDVTYTCKLNIPNDKLKSILAEIATGEQSLIIHSISESIPYNSSYDFRKTPARRALAYAPMVKRYLDDNQFDEYYLKNFVRFAMNSLADYDNRLMLWEKQFSTTSTTYDNGTVSFYALFVHFDIHSALRQLKMGAGKMIEQNHYSFSDLISVFNRIDAILDFKGYNDIYFHLNFFARYLLNIAKRLDAKENIETVFTVEYKINNQPKSMIFTQKK